MTEPAHHEPGSLPHVLAGVPGLTYRQLDYWTRCGVVWCVGGNNGPGSGNQRRWDTESYHVLRRMVLLRGAGVNLPLAKALAWGQTDQLAPGVLLVFGGDL